MSQQTRTPSRVSSHTGQDNKSSNAAQLAALSGATKAFGRPTPQQRTSSNASFRDNGAAAGPAGTVGSRTNSPQGRRYARSPARPLIPASTGGSIQSVKSDVISTGRALNLQPPSQQSRQQHSKSPSLQAASLAAARATPQPQNASASNRQMLSARSDVVRRPSAPPKPKRLSSQRSVQKATLDPERPTEETSIPPTTSLANLFEQKNRMEPQSRQQEPVFVKPSTDLALRSPKPIRTSEGGLTAVFQMELPDVKRQTTSGKNVSPASSGGSSQDSFASASESATMPASPDHHGPAPRRFSGNEKVPARPSSISRQPVLPVEPPKASKPWPIKQPPQRSMTATSDRLSPSSASVRSIPAQFNQLYPRAKAPPMSGDQLANAMVASSLASSRVGSPAHPDPPLKPRHKHQTFGFSRTPSPTKGMKHTLRKAETESESDEDPYSKHKKKRHLRPKHPNKHHEGDRKRWRDAVSERERKRYEGVWAANKGLYCSLTKAEEATILRSMGFEEALDMQAALGEQVSNIVCRDLWQRSRLPEHTLANVWDLVDNNQVGRLTKIEFVVAMFLIDYCLKGRKLPIKVSDSVWASVRGLQGIKVRKKL